MKGARFAAGVLILASGAFALWAGSQRPDFQSSAGSPTDGDTRRDTIRAMGYVEPVSELRRLVFKVDGVIDQCHVEIGQQVRAGQLLMTLRNQVEQSAVHLAEQELAVAVAERDQLLAGTPTYKIAAAEATVELMKEQLRHAEKQMTRVRPLFEQKTLTAEEFDRTDNLIISAQKSLRQSESELAHLKNVIRDVDRMLADARIKRAEAILASARSRLTDTELRAPRDGTVLEILRREGEAPRLLDREPVIVLADMSQLRVRAEIDERFVTKVRPGQVACVSGRGLVGRNVLGSVVFVKELMGPKTVFSRDSAERKDLDIVQVLIDLPREFRVPLGLQVDIELIDNSLPAPDAPSPGGS